MCQFLSTHSVKTLLFDGIIICIKDGKCTDHWHCILETRINVLLEDLCVLQKVVKNLYLVVISLKLTGTEPSTLLNINLKLGDWGFILCYIR